MTWSFQKYVHARSLHLKLLGPDLSEKGRLWYNAQTTLPFHCIPSLWNLKHFHRNNSEHDESLSNVTFNSLLLDSDNIKSDCLGDWSALTNSDDITNSSSLESWRHVGWQVMMSLLESVVFLDIMQIIPSQDHSTVHPGWEDHTLEDSASDWNLGGEWALFVNINVLLLHCSLWSFETKTNFLIVMFSDGTLALENLLGVLEDSCLLLISFFSLDVSHVCCSRIDEMNL